jgi:hypothetical protein
MSRNTSGTSSQQAEIPDFLKPYFSAQAGTGLSALQNLQGQLGNAGAQQLVAGFTPAQLQGQQAAINLATGQGGQFDVTKNTLQDFTSGAAIAQESPGVLRALNAGMTAANLPGVDMSTVQGFAQSGVQMDDASRQALGQSAQGGFMYGNPAFDEAVQASMRAARPSILSGFAAQGGAGAAKSGLAQIGMQQAASDSFARLFGDERNRQISAAGQLGNFSLSSRGLQQDAAGQGLQAQLQQRSQDVQQQQLRNQAAQAFGGIIGDERQRQLSAAGMFGDVEQRQLQNQLLASQTLQDVGLTQQQQKQLELMAPISAQQMLLAASSGMPQFNSLIGQSGTSTGTNTDPIYRNKGAGALGGALTGAQLGSMFGPMGTGIGAVGGGLLGLLG